MTTGIEKFKQVERIRRLFFKHRGNIPAIIEETGLDGNYIRKVARKIRKGFSRDVNFQTACFITDAILSGREQRLILLEERLQEVLNKKEVVSRCCKRLVNVNYWEQEPRYKCLGCGADCDILEADIVNDNTVVKLIDRMRKEDELVAKFLAAIGLIAAQPLEETVVNTKPVQSTPVKSEQKSLPPAERRLIEKLGTLSQSEIAEIRRMVEDKVNEKMDGTSQGSE